MLRLLHLYGCLGEPEGPPDYILLVDKEANAQSTSTASHLRT